jgi:hypothetical protein
MRTLIALDTNKEVLHFLARPGRFSQKGQTGLYTGIKPEAPYVNDTAEILPSEMINQFCNDHFQCFAV